MPLLTLTLLCQADYALPGHAGKLVVRISDG